MLAAALGAVLAACAPGPAPSPSGLFDAARCSGDIAYSFVGWTTTDRLWIPFQREGRVWAMVTRDALKLTEGDWQDDPNGSGHRYQIWGRRVCLARPSLEADRVMEFATVLGTEWVLWDDGLLTPGENPARPAAPADACAPEQLRLSITRMGPAAGSMVATFEVRLVSGDACRVTAWPGVVIVDAGDRVVASSQTNGDLPAPTETLLRDRLEFHLYWGGWCDPRPVGPFTAEILLLGDRAVSLELGRFGPSGCNGGPGSVGIEPAWQ